MSEPLSLFLRELWWISVETAPYLLLGFGVAALLHRYIPTDWLIRYLAGGKVRSTAMAAALGAPLPLCSCSVVPAALALRKKGASRGATLSFFISTPETGVDSILLTYGLLGPVLAVARPLAAILSAFTAGLLLESLPDRDAAETEDSPTACTEHTQPVESYSSCETSEMGSTTSCCDGSGNRERHPLPRWTGDFRDSFLMLFDEIAVWVALGLVLSALVGAFLPREILETAQGWRGMALAILIGLPIYVCATASTPLAAVMIGKGVSVGAALVFLLVGPATNIGTVAVVWRILGGWAVFAYLTVIIGVSIAFGASIDIFFPRFGEGLAPLGAVQQHEYPFILSVFAVFLWILLIWRTGKRSVWPRQKG